MNFRIASTFTASLARLTGDEQKAVKTTAFDLQMNPVNPGMSFHKLDKARDRNFWSVRVNRDVRLIVHRAPQSLLLCFAGHHDDAYHWAECRKIETHPTTGAAQIVEIRQRYEEIKVPRYVEVDRPVPTSARLFAGISDEELLACGVPEEWLPDVRAVNSDDALLALIEHLPAEAAEALLELATGGIPSRVPDAVTALEKMGSSHEPFALKLELPALPSIESREERQRALDERRSPKPAEHVIAPTPESADGPVTAPSPAAFRHVDAQRRFRTIESREELERALDAPWDKWTIFLHPAQRESIERDYGGPARVSGSAGTGKTIVALHRAVLLARAHPESRVLLATFSETLANALRVKLRRLIGNTPKLAERIDVAAMDTIGARLYGATSGPLRIATSDEVGALLASASAAHPGHGFSAAFLRAEWDDVADAWQLSSWEAYRDVQRLGRKTRLPESRRQVLWEIFDDVRRAMSQRRWITNAGMFGRLAEEMPERRQPPYDFAVIDEAQDISVAQLRFLAAMGGGRPNALFFAGDLGQRIFRQPFSWKSLGVDVRGRSRTLHVNYRTSHQIRTQADRLLDPVVADVDGNEEERAGTVSVFNGPAPVVCVSGNESEESDTVADWLRSCIADGFTPAEIAVFVRSGAERQRATDAVGAAGLTCTVLDDRMQVEPDCVVVGTMHLAKGLEFRAVAVMACDDDVIPSQRRIANVADESDLEDVYDTERHLLYVACTRARDRLLVSGVAPASEFLEDLTSA